MCPPPPPPSVGTPGTPALGTALHGVSLERSPLFSQEDFPLLMRCSPLPPRHLTGVGNSFQLAQSPVVAPNHVSPTELPSTGYTRRGETGPQAPRRVFLYFLPCPVGHGSWADPRSQDSGSPGAMGTRRHHCPRLGLLCAPVAGRSLHHHIKATGGRAPGSTPQATPPGACASLPRPDRRRLPVPSGTGRRHCTCGWERAHRRPGGGWGPWRRRVQLRGASSQSG